MKLKYLFITFLLFTINNNSAIGNNYVDDSDYLESLKRANILRNEYPGWLNTLKPCACSAREAENDDYFEENKNTDFLADFHPGAVREFRTKKKYVKPLAPADLDGDIIMPGQQCTYASSGQLITHGPGAGTPDAYSPTVTFVGEGLFFRASHEYWDVDTFDPNGYDKPFILSRRIFFEDGENRIEGLPWYVYTQTWIPSKGNNCKPFPDTNSFYLDVDARDFNGIAWDTWLLGFDEVEPEIIVCMSSSINSNPTCIAGKENSYVFYSTIPYNLQQSSKLYFQVYDNDTTLFRKELIGKGFCSINQACRIGKAYLLFMSPQ